MTLAEQTGLPRLLAQKVHIATPRIWYRGQVSDSVGDVDPCRSQPAVFEAVVGLLDYPMFVVTACVEGVLAGCLVGFASQVSIDPPRFLVGLSVKNHTYRIAREAQYLAVHVIAREHRDLARLFGEKSGDNTDKFALCAWHRGPHGVLILDAAAAWFTGRILERLPLGDHVAFLLAPEDGHAPQRLEELLMFSDVRDIEAGHEA